MCLPSVSVIKGLLRSNAAAIDLNASLSPPLTIYDNYHYTVMEMVTIYQRHDSRGVHNGTTTATNSLR